MSRIISVTLPICQLSAEQKSVMFSIFEKYYSGVSFAQFCNDLSEKSHIFLFKNGDNEIIGFSTILQRQVQAGNKSATLLYSGDTVIEKHYWGKKFLQKSFFWYILKAKFKSLFQPVYWMLISKGFKTYLLMRKNFPASYPNSLGATPDDLQKIMNEFYGEKFGANYRPEKDLIEFSGESVHVKDNLACPQDKALQDEDVKFFLKKNPKYLVGQELTCIAEIRLRDFFAHILKFFVPKKVLNHMVSAYRADARWTVATLLMSYLILGFTVLGFNRSPLQVLLTIVLSLAFQVLLDWLLHRKVYFPLSTFITSLGVSLLLNYSHGYWTLLLPVFFSIAAKAIFTFNGRHVFNPAMITVVISLLCTSDLIAAAPAYQWNGPYAMAVFIVMPALLLFVPRINRYPLIISFLTVFTLQTFLRGLIIRHYLPFETLFLGTITSPSFFLFTFFMITDPMTSPNDKKQQIIMGSSLALIDLLYHVFRSYHTFFYAAATLATIKFIINHVRAFLKSESFKEYFYTRAIASGYWRRPVYLGIIFALGFGTYKLTVTPDVSVSAAGVTTELISPHHTGIVPKFGDVYERVDPGAQHIAKWLLVSEGVATGDYDGDGLQDLFFTNGVKSNADRNALYHNDGDFRFSRVALPAIALQTQSVEGFGLPGNAMFVDYDSDGDLDLFITYAFGRSMMLQNRLLEEGDAKFVDVSDEVGPFDYSISVAANFMDINRDGKLDLIIANAMTRHLPDYPTSTVFNLFHLPKPEYPGDQRPFHFMHESWHLANNGDVNDIYLFDGKKYHKQNSAEWGLPETRWSLALATADFNRDGFTDMYVANDFGPDDFYFNEGGKSFRKVVGTMFGSIGKDTYKGMNASVADFDNNGYLDVYVSNVHHPLQAEGSLLWFFYPTSQGDPEIKDMATTLGALNENRFGWGGAATDINNDGLVDIVQVNGMVDDSQDKRYARCPDYWYINEKLARSPPSIHGYANMWGDIRGACIHSKENNRIYLNRGVGVKPQFADIASFTGFAVPGTYRGVSAVDLDNDGVRDLIVTSLFNPPQFFKTKNATANHWIGFQLVGDGRKCNAGAIGSRVEVLNQTQEAQVVSGFSAQNDMRLHFGLGAHGDRIDAAVTWCGREKKIYKNLTPNQYHVLEMTPQIQRAAANR